MDRDERVDRHIKIFFRIGAGLFVPPGDPQILPLGERYASKMSRLLNKRSAIFEEIKTELGGFSDEEFEKIFGSDGQPLSDESEDLVARHKESVKDAFEGLEIWYLAPMFRTDDLADFDHWGKADYLSIDEVVWLSVGFDPLSEHLGPILPFSDLGKGKRLDPIATYIGRHKEIIRRKFDPHNHGSRPNLNELFVWVNEVSLDVHPEFRRIIEKRQSTVSVVEGNDAGLDEPIKMDSRERASMSKLIAAMAINCYGFDPKSRRSDIPKEIQSIADRLGLGLTTNTIRKYLRQGAESLPKDWEP